LSVIEAQASISLCIIIMRLELIINTLLNLGLETFSLSETKERKT
jgi:hypothetical protein